MRGSWSVTAETPEPSLTSAVSATSRLRPLCGARDESLRENTAPLTVFMGLVVSLKPPSFHRVRGVGVLRKTTRGPFTSSFQNHVDLEKCGTRITSCASDWTFTCFRAVMLREMLFRGRLPRGLTVIFRCLSCCLRCTRQIGFFCRDRVQPNCFRAYSTVDAWFRQWVHVHPSVYGGLWDNFESFST